jgi:hypothetical protein
VVVAGLVLVPALVVILNLVAPRYEASLPVRFEQGSKGRSAPAAPQLEIEPVLRELVRKVGWRGSLAELRKRLFVVQHGDASRAELVVQGASREEVRATALAWVAAFRGYYSRAAPQEGRVVVEDPSPAVERQRSVLLAIPLGLLIGVSLALVVPTISRGLAVLRPPRPRLGARTSSDESRR